MGSLLPIPNQDPKLIYSIEDKAEKNRVFAAITNGIASLQYKKKIEVY